MLDRKTHPAVVEDADPLVPAAGNTAGPAIYGTILSILSSPGRGRPRPSRLLVST